MPAQANEGSLRPSNCGFGSCFSFSAGTDTAHVNLLAAQPVTSTQATPKCHLWVPTGAAEALLFSKCCFKPPHGGQQDSGADSSSFGGGWRQPPITQPALLSRGFWRLPSCSPLILLIFHQAAELWGQHSFLDACTELSLAGHRFGPGTPGCWSNSNKSRMFIDYMQRHLLLRQYGTYSLQRHLEPSTATRTFYGTHSRPRWRLVTHRNKNGSGTSTKASS